MKKFLTIALLLFTATLATAETDAEKIARLEAENATMKTAIGIIGESGSGYKSAVDAASLPVIKMVQGKYTVIGETTPRMVWVIPGGQSRTLTATPGADFEKLQADKAKIDFTLAAAGMSGKVGQMVLITAKSDSGKNVVAWLPVAGS